jgi:hypothetical protein
MGKDFNLDTNAPRHADFYEPGKEYNSAEIIKLVERLIHGNQDDVRLAGSILMHTSHIFNHGTIYDRKKDYSETINALSDPSDGMIDSILYFGVIDRNDFNEDELKDFGMAIGTDLNLKKDKKTKYTMNEEELVLYQKYIQEKYDDAFNDWCDINFPEETIYIRYD